MKFFFIGIGIGLLGGLWSNVIHDELQNLGNYYVFFLTILSLGIGITLIKHNRKKIDKKMKRSVLKHYWESEIKKRGIS